MNPPHDLPTSGELLAAVREWLERDIVAASVDPLRFNARVAANILAIVEREIAAGDAPAARHAARLALLGAESDAELAARIRSGDLDGSLLTVLDTLEPSIRDKVAVANPGYLEG